MVTSRVRMPCFITTRGAKPLVWRTAALRCPDSRGRLSSISNRTVSPAIAARTSNPSPSPGDSATIASSLPRNTTSIMRHRLKIFLSLSLVLTGCVTLPPAIDRAAAVPELRGAIWGIDVEDDSGRVLYQRNGHTLLMPASNRKLFAASTAINCFGLDHRFATELWLDGSNVVIRGTGDPSLGGRWTFDRDAVFATFIAALRARGVQSVDDVIGDPSAFDRDTIPESWKFGNLGSDYAAPVDALAYNENSVDGMAVVDPPLYAAQAFRDSLHNAGIEVRGNTWVSTIPRTWKERVAVIESPFLSQLVATMLKVSQNL